MAPSSRNGARRATAAACIPSRRSDRLAGKPAAYSPNDYTAITPSYQSSLHNMSTSQNTTGVQESATSNTTPIAQATDSSSDLSSVSSGESSYRWGVSTRTTRTTNTRAASEKHDSSSELTPLGSHSSEDPSLPSHNSLSLLQQHKNDALATDSSKPPGAQIQLPPLPTYPHPSSYSQPTKNEDPREGLPSGTEPTVDENERLNSLISPGGGCTCPINTFHFYGLYLHGRTIDEAKELPKEAHPKWGYSDPPPEVWDAYERIEQRKATDKDESLVEGFSSCHKYYPGDEQND